MPDSGSKNNNSMGVSLSDILFSSMLQKYIVCDVCRLKFFSFESSGVLYITPDHNSSMQKLMSCFHGKKNAWHDESNHILQ